jgi:hypothetical protein
LTVVAVEWKGPEDVDRVFTTIRKERAEALNLLEGAATIHMRTLPSRIGYRQSPRRGDRQRKAF